MSSNTRNELKKIIIRDIDRSNVKNQNELRHILQCKYEHIFGFDIVKEVLKEIFNAKKIELDDPKYDLCDILIYVHKLECIQN